MPIDVSRADVAFRVKKIIAEQLDLPKDGLDNDASIVDDLGADSLEVVQIRMLIEDGFSMTFPDEADEDISAVGQTIDFVLAMGERGANGFTVM
ncbi:acyl carrier protein [Mycoplana sp. BE70]|uniref:acyl carrier protein n=1 Tax=Mycoplana sp. BE70 TaxID=2817775 RepID=UPI002857BE66|nr:acyl carrier protein [Mycoplana sp. BE70]MDR6759702.1 acyl carrier protein [Mycoplana sp. BE70]